MVWMFFVEQVCHKDILEFMQTLRKRRCPQPKEIEDILSVGFLLIPLVAPYDQFLILSMFR